MAQNILLTSLSSVETGLPTRYFSAKTGSVSAFFDALLDAEAGIKTVLSQYDLDEIIVIGASGSYAEGDELGPVDLKYGSKMDSSDKFLSTYGLLQYRIAQYAEGQTQDRNGEDKSLPEEVRAKLINFIREFPEGNTELKSKGLGGLFAGLAQSNNFCENFWHTLFAALPELSDDPNSCKLWVMKYLYEELDPSSKIRLLPANEGACLRFIPEDEFEDSEQWVNNLMSMGKSIVEDVEDINLYVALNSDDAADTFIVLNMLDILISMPESNVLLNKIFTVRSPQGHMTGIVRDDTDGFGVAELFHGIRAFLNYGRSDMIMDIWKKSGESNKSIESMVYAMRDVDVGLSMCNMQEVERGILCLRELFRSETFWRESGYYGVLFSLIAESIREDYGGLLEGDGDINFIEMVKWAYRHQFYQQTLTLIESATPENLVKTGIFYYCDDEASVDQVMRLFAEQRLRLRPYEYFKMDQIDHYFIKTYGRYRTRGRGAKGDDPRHMYAVLRTESVYNQDLSVITGFTACDNLETLQNVLFAYYNVGFVRNKISHADSNAMELRNQAASDSDDISALTWMKESIDLFIDSYEKAVAEVQDKTPNVVIITGNDVRELAQSMAKEPEYRGRRRRRRRH